MDLIEHDDWLEAKEMEWPNGKSFAFTIIDDTDEATVANVKPIYDLLAELGIWTTKTVWAFPPRDEFGGESLSEKEYALFIKEIAEKGFEIAFHGAGSGAFIREETLEALEMIRNLVGTYPSLYVNHAHNAANLYWNAKRFTFVMKGIYGLSGLISRDIRVASQGEVEASPYFWGDFSRKHIKYIRNRTFSGINTLKYDKAMPYRNRRTKKFSNYWFSSSDGYNCSQFLKVLTRENINRLEKEQGCAILYTHFAYGFVDRDGQVNEDFIRRMNDLAGKNGWFAPASEILDYIQSSRTEDICRNGLQEFCLDVRWAAERINRKIFGGE